jgi:mono/diheme cytochrome c family protein
MVPPDLEKVLQDVARRRCASCHKPDRRGRPGIPRKPWIRITHAERNGFLAAPLAARHGGMEACGKVVFESPDDPDYRRILATFQPITKLLQAQPRMDMLKHP